MQLLLTSATVTQELQGRTGRATVHGPVLALQSSGVPPWRELVVVAPVPVPSGSSQRPSGGCGPPVSWLGSQVGTCHLLTLVGAHTSAEVAWSGCLCYSLKRGQTFEVQREDCCPPFCTTVHTEEQSQGTQTRFQMTINWETEPGRALMAFSCSRRFCSGPERAGRTFLFYLFFHFF